MTATGYTPMAMAAPTKKKTQKHPKVAAWVRAIFDASGAKSQEAIAERLGVSRGGFAKWYYGDQRPMLDELQRLEKLAVEVGIGVFADFDAARYRATNVSGTNEMSDPRSINAADSNLEAFIDRNAEDVTEREKRFLRGLRFKGSPTAETWSALLEAFRAGRSSREG